MKKLLLLTALCALCASATVQINMADYPLVYFLESPGYGETYEITGTSGGTITVSNGDEMNATFVLLDTHFKAINILHNRGDITIVASNSTLQTVHVNCFTTKLAVKTVATSTIGEILCQKEGGVMTFTGAPGADFRCNTLNFDTINIGEDASVVCGLSGTNGCVVAKEALNVSGALSITSSDLNTVVTKAATLSEADVLLKSDSDSSAFFQADTLYLYDGTALMADSQVDWFSGTTISYSSGTVNYVNNGTAPAAPVVGNPGGETRYLVTLPGLGNQDATYHVSFYDDGGAKVLEYNGPSFHRYLASYGSSADNMSFYLPDGTYEAVSGDRTFKGAVSGGPAVFEEVPEPAALALLAFLGLAFLRRK